MKTRIAWRGVIGWLLIAFGAVFGMIFAPWPINGVTIGSLLLIGIGGIEVGRVITK